MALGLLDSRTSTSTTRHASRHFIWVQITIREVSVCPQDVCPTVHFLPGDGLKKCICGARGHGRREPFQPVLFCSGVMYHPSPARSSLQRSRWLHLRLLMSLVPLFSFLKCRVEENYPSPVCWSCVHQPEIHEPREGTHQLIKHPHALPQGWTC